MTGPGRFLHISPGHEWDRKGASGRNCCIYTTMAVGNLPSLAVKQGSWNAKLPFWDLSRSSRGGIFYRCLLHNLYMSPIIEASGIGATIWVAEHRGWWLTSAVEGLNSQPRIETLQFLMTRSRVVSDPPKPTQGAKVHEIP